MRPVIAILGGSSPFTAALVEAVRSPAAGVAAAELRLFGRDATALATMERYGKARLAHLGWIISATQRLDEAVDGAAVVVNQIRFGGLAGRARDEALANRFQLPADETLGPCGLLGALRVTPRLRELAAELGRRCPPDAWVLNLSNPLSVTTGAMIRAGAPRHCVGLCELPYATVLETCRVLGMSPADVAWRYAGLNHRGFIFSLQHRGEELLPRLPELLQGETIFGVTADDIRQVGALPLKYFRLSNTPSAPAPSDRAHFLVGLREAIARELDETGAPPPSLSKRYLRWYEDAVVPMIAAICADARRSMIINCMRDDGLVWEVPALVSRTGFEVVATELPARILRWVERWAAHERALFDAVISPSIQRIEHALELDPTVPKAQVRELASAILAESRN